MANPDKVSMEYRGYRIEPIGTYPLFRVIQKGSGVVPKSLGGTFTSLGSARKQVDMQLQSLCKGRKVKDGEAGSKATG